ncbi:MAG TPA: hypothetical protein IGS17_16645 [Oscillatoriales cyanobacterium M59_W2019_021]|nr:hypothetical protein [Oscillatoriales cyanobacterium M4454_W2019_049]HIK52534.1 hypothetical protein [Oscillatoriales cyanobacterium M59_W2019_021]
MMRIVEPRSQWTTNNADGIGLKHPERFRAAALIYPSLDRLTFRINN